MATNLLSISAVTIRATADNTNRRRKTSSAAVSGGGKWWTPVFGWSADADYIENSNTDSNARKAGEMPARKTARFTPSFTEEKAKELRMRTKESFHDVMYHSAIASRLATDFSTRCDSDE